MGSTRDTLKRVFRKTVKWGGAGLTVLLVLVWIGTGWCLVSRNSQSGSIDMLWCGCYMHYLSKSGASDDQPYWEWTSWGDASFESEFVFMPGSNFGEIQIPLWCPALLSLLATAAAWRADAKYLRRVREGACAGCGYDRAGLAAGSLCPECGKQPEAR